MTITIPTLNGSQLVEPISIKGNLVIIQVSGVYTIVLVKNGLSPTGFIPTLELAESIREKLLKLAPNWSNLPDLRSTKGKRLREAVRKVVEDAV
jgi:hypothetical protein